MPDILFLLVLLVNLSGLPVLAEKNELSFEINQFIFNDVYLVPLIGMSISGLNGPTGALSGRFPALYGRGLFVQIYKSNGRPTFHVPSC
jgi:hypothetical protein